MKKHILFVLVSTLVFASQAQKKTIDHTAYFGWKKTEKQQISSKGKHISYETNPLRGDGMLYVYTTSSEKKDSFARGKDAQWFYNEQLVAFKVVPGFDTLRTCELKKIDKKKWPKDSLYILDFTNDTLIRVPKLKQFEVAAKGTVLAYLTEGNELVKGIEKKKKKCFLKKKKEEKPEPKSDGNVLTLWQNPKKSWQVKNVTDFRFSKDGAQLAVLRHTKDKVDSVELSIWNPETREMFYMFPKYVAVKLPVWNEKQDRLAFFYSMDTSKTKQYNLCVYDFKTKESQFFGDTSQAFFPKERGISENRTPVFTDNGKYLFFGVAKRVQPEKKDTLLESEKVKLDIWNYQDEQLQPQQLVELKEKKRRTDLYVLQLETGKILPLVGDSLKIEAKTNWLSDYFLLTDPKPYSIEAQWKSPGFEDVYRVSIVDGKKELLGKRMQFAGNLSPSGKYFTYFDAAKQQYMCSEMGKNTFCLSCSEPNVKWADDINGEPSEAGPVGELGYTPNEQQFIFKSQYDIWTYDFNTGKLSSLTERKGEKESLRWDLQKWSSDSLYLHPGSVYFKVFNRKTKGDAVYFWNDLGGLDKKLEGAFKLTSLERSKDASMYLYRTSTLEKYPELQITTDSFNSSKTISLTNPQQHEYKWGKVNLVQWKAYDGTPLEGLLYMPETIDPQKKYPLLVYYYELNSDNLFVHQAPRPSASTINPLEYASADYFVLIPDIRYQAGKPAKSAYNCIMSGTDFVIRNFPIDSTRMGLQGQSWGGYQTAQLITMTPRYAAAMAGAPVGNMFSAYGGIRWGSGLSRQFQYESAQSRIGKTIWDAPQLYTENSPIFGLPKVKTPLLIMHNDKDGAVPWYQGIEIFTGMRRLGLPCWMLNYNEDDHNLTKLPNKMDLSIRMRQFFDFYLQGKPMPVWMKEGIPAIDKGEKTGYETE